MRSNFGELFTASKKSLITTLQSYSTKISVAAIFIMLAGMLLGRAILSIGMILFIVAAIFSQSFYSQLAIYRSHSWLWCMGLLFTLPFVSGLWSENISSWQRLMEIKVPLLLMPFCGIVFMKYTQPMFKWVNIFFVGIIFIGCSWSMWQYSKDFSGIQEEYLRAGTIPTPMSNEHVRFSWAVVLAYLVLLYETINGFSKWDRALKILALAVLVVFGVYLHLLSARTGIMGFFLINLLLAIYFLRKRLLLLFSTFGIIVLMPILGWYFLPTFQNRIKFVWWDFQNYSQGNYVEGLSDTPRILSIKGGWQIMNQHPVLGTGFGDLNQEMMFWYDKHATFLLGYERLMPSNQWLIYSDGAGIIAGCLFLIVAVMPFLLRSLRKNIFWICTHLITFIIFVYEIPLETQFGVFIYSFFGVWLYWLLKSKEHEAHEETQRPQS